MYPNNRFLKTKFNKNSETTPGRNLKAFSLLPSSAQATSCPSIQNSSTQTNTQSSASDLDIGLHLSQNPVRDQHYDDSRFSILVQGRSIYPLLFHSCPRPLLFPSISYSFHLSTFIKTSNPALCRQKEFVYCLEIVY